MYTFLQIDKKLLMIKVHFFLALAGSAPIIPFLSTISMQRGYSSAIVGLIFTLLPLPALIVRPVVGALTDKYKCRKIALITLIVINCLIISVLMFIPGTAVKTEIANVNVIKSPNFWLFFTTVAMLNTCTSVRSILENTICIGLLGENKHKYGQQRVWGAVGWGTISFLAGVVIDWFSKGQDYKNFTPGMIIALMACILDVFVALKIEFKTALDHMPNHTDQYRIVINANMVPQGQHYRGRFNAQSQVEMAVLMIGEEYGNRDIILSRIDENVQRINETHRYVHKKNMDAMTYVRNFGTLNLFITFTCNPNWTEIKRELKHGQTTQDRHNIITRVFHEKMKVLMHLTVKHRMFGETQLKLKLIVVENSEDKIEVSNVKKMLTNIRVLSFLLWVVAFGFFNAFIWYYLFWYLEDLSSIYHPETIPYIKTLEGLTQTIQCFGGEVPFFFLSSYILKLVDNMKVFSLMFFVFAARFFLYSIITNPVYVLPVELVNGLTYALAYSAATSYAAELAPVGAEGTLQGIVGTALLGIGAPVGSFVGGQIFYRFGSITSFQILSGTALVVCITQTTINFLMNRFSKDKNFKENASSTNGLSIDAIDNNYL